MNTPHFWLLLAFAMWFVVAVWAYNKFSQTPILSKRDFESNDGEKESFPLFFWYLYSALWTIWPLAFFATMFLVVLILPWLQGLYLGPDVVTFSSPDTYFLASSLVVILAMVSFLLIGKQACSYFPKFDKYQALRNKLATQAFRKLKWRTQQKKIVEATPVYNEEKLALAEWRKLLKTFLFIWLTAFPLFVLTVDTYVLTTKDAVYANRFFKITADSVLFSNAKSAKMHFTSSSNCYGRGGCSQPHLVPHLDIYFSNGTTYDVWGSLGRDYNDQGKLIEVIKNLKALDIPISVIPMDTRERDTLPSYDDSKREIIDQIIEEAKKP